MQRGDSASALAGSAQAQVTRSGCAKLSCGEDELHTSEASRARQLFALEGGIFF
jgi:hypothetical protein